MIRNINKTDFLRPLKLSILLSILGELIIFIVWGVILYPEGNILHKFLWTIVFCGFGMGSAAGSLILILVNGRYTGKKAIVYTIVISTILLGVFCNVLCHNLDMHFDYFGGAETPTLFLINGIIMSIIGGWIVGWLSFTEKGKKLLRLI